MKQFVVDAFTNKVFSGNPAAVCVLDEWVDDNLMMLITRENNLSETAFVVKKEDKYHLRWFTPGGEIDLCGHATLGCAYVIMNYYDTTINTITFVTLSGDLIVEKQGEFYEMNFPAYELKKVAVSDAMEKALGIRPIEAYMARDLLCVLEDVDIRKIQPDMDRVKELDGLLLHITTSGKNFDCESRSFAPKLNVTEDPVCGSGHCHIVPYWVNKLKKESLQCYQASTRGGILYCYQDGKRIKMSGNVALYSISELNV